MEIGLRDSLLYLGLEPVLVAAAFMLPFVIIFATICLMNIYCDALKTRAHLLFSVISVGLIVGLASKCELKVQESNH